MNISTYTCVIYWPSTEPSIKRCTCVNKQENCGSRRTYENNISRFVSSRRQECQSENRLQTEGFGLSMTHGWATQAKMRKKCCYGQEKNLGQYSSLSLSPLISHTQQNITLSKIKCERFIFVERSVFVRLLKSSLLLTMFPANIRNIFVCVYV